MIAIDLFCGLSKAQFFARRVNHPGTKPYPFLVPAARRALEAVGLGKVIEAWNDGA